MDVREMSYEDFLNQAAADLQMQMPGVEVVIREMEKLQGESYLGLAFMQEGSPVQPIMNLTHEYDQIQHGADYSKVLKDVVNKVSTALQDRHGFSLEQLTDYGRVKDKLALQLVPQKGNEKILQDVPHRDMEDLALIYRIDLGGGATATIHNKTLAEYGITEEQLHEDAIRSAAELHPANIATMSEMLGMPDMGGPALYVATNDNGIFGASVVAYPGMLEEAAQRLQGDYYILPSSIHEVLLISAKEAQDYHDLETMVRQINETEVSPADRLSDKVYRFDSKDRIFELAEKHEKRMQEKTSEKTAEKGLGKLKEKKAEAAIQPKRQAQPEREAMAL